MWYKNIAQQFISLGHMEAVTVASSAFCPLSCWKCAGKGQRSVLTGLGVRVAVTLSAAVRWGLFVVLFLREAQGQRLGGAGTAIGLLLSKPAVSAALLRAVWEVKGHAALRLLNTHTHTNTQQSSWAGSGFRISERTGDFILNIYSSASESQLWTCSCVCLEMKNIQDVLFTHCKKWTTTCYLKDEVCNIWIISVTNGVAT